MKEESVGGDDWSSERHLWVWPRIPVSSPDPGSLPPLLGDSDPLHMHIKHMWRSSQHQEFGPIERNTNTVMQPSSPTMGHVVDAVQISLTWGLVEKATFTTDNVQRKNRWIMDTQGRARQTQYNKHQLDAYTTALQKRQLLVNCSIPKLNLV